MDELKEHTFKWYEFGCKDASYLLTKQESAALRASERLLLKFHMSTCKYCRRFVKQIKAIETVLKKEALSETLSLSSERKQLINQLITENLTKS